MKWKRTAMSLALAGCMMATTVPVTAFAAETTVASEYAADRAISFAESSGTMVVGTKINLGVLTTADNPVKNEDKISWVSSNPEIANFVDDDSQNASGEGVTGFSQDIVAFKAGTTTITATFQNNNVTSVATYTLTVVDRIAFTGTTLDKTYVELTTAEAEDGQTTVPTSNSTTVVTATSNTNDVVTYTTEVLNGQEDGAGVSTVVTAEADDATGKITLTAQKPGAAMVKVTTTATYTKANGDVDTTVDVDWIEVKVTRLAGTDLLTTFEIKTVAGLPNEDYPTVAMMANKTLQLVPYFNGAPNGVVADGNTDPITQEDVAYLTYTGDKTVKWTSNNTDIATVDSNGLVTGIKEGKTDIFAYSANGMIAHLTIDVLAEVIEVTSIDLKVKNMSVPVGGVNNESIVFTPENTTQTYGTVTYTIVDNSNAGTNGDIIDADLFELDGTVFGKNVGTVQVMASYHIDGRTLTAFGTVTVTKEGSLEQVTEISIAGGDLVGENVIPFNGSVEVPDYSVKPAVCKAYTTENVTWTIADESIAKIVGGRIVGLKNGTTTLTATVNGHASTIMIEVAGTSNLTGVTLDIHKVTVVLPGDTTKGKFLIANLGAGISTSSADIPGGLIWTSSDENVATVDADGKVYGVGVGTATITVTAGNYTDTCVVTVIDPDNLPTDTTDTITFVDVPSGAWYYDAVYDVAEKGLMNGIGDNKFDPLGTVERSQVATIIWNMAGSPEPTALSSFTDVASDAWYAKPVAWAAENGVVAGIGGGKFGPSLAITREDFVSMLYRYAGSPAASGDLSKFSDASSVSAYAQNAMKWAVSEGIVSGTDTGKLNPKSTLIRAEAASIISRYTTK